MRAWSSACRTHEPCQSFDELSTCIARCLSGRRIRLKTDGAALHATRIHQSRTSSVAGPDTQIWARKNLPARLGRPGAKARRMISARVDPRSRQSAELQRRASTAVGTGNPARLADPRRDLSTGRKLLDGFLDSVLGDARAGSGSGQGAEIASGLLPSKPYHHGGWMKSMT